MRYPTIGSLLLSILVCVPLRAELVAQWPLEGTVSARKGGSHGTAKGNPTWAADRYGDGRRAMSLDGKDDCLDCGSNERLSFGDGTTDRPFSIGAWVKMDTHRGFAMWSST